MLPHVPWVLLQDYAYVKGQCMELTVELSQDKWPPENELPGLFDNNLPAMLAFPLAAAFSGLRYACCCFRSYLAADKGYRPYEHAATTTLPCIVSYPDKAGPLAMLWLA